MFFLNNPQIDNDMEVVDHDIRAALLNARYSTPIRRSLQTLADHPGKRLRPILVLLCYRAVNPSGSLPVSVGRLAAAIELIHMASLIHDDIIDHADMRHGRDSFYKEFGVEVAIPIGVLLYSMSLGLLASIGDLDIIKRVSRAVDQLCIGELDQVLNRNQFDVSVADYLIVLKKKTSALFALAAWGGVRLGSGSSQLSRLAMSFGNALGLLFQVSDDLLDFTGQDSQLEKGSNQDFILGEITLPLIYLLASLDTESRSKAIQLMETKDPVGVSWLYSQVQMSDAFERCAELMETYENRCMEFVSALPDSGSRRTLAAVVGYISGRAGL